MKYPILILDPKTEKFYTFQKEKDFTITTVELIYVFENLLVVDSLGNVYEIRGAKKTGWGNAFWGFSLSGRKIKIQLNIQEKNQKYSIEELKAFLLEKPFRLDLFDDPEESLLEERIVGIKNAVSFIELMKVLS